MRMEFITYYLPFHLCGLEKCAREFGHVSTMCTNNRSTTSMFYDMLFEKGISSHLNSHSGHQKVYLLYNVTYVCIGYGSH